MKQKSLFSFLMLVMICCSGGTVFPQTHGEDLTDVLFFQYRLFFSGLLGRSCVFEPSCSRYAREAVGSKGPVLGIMTGLERWTRCHSGAYSCGDYRQGVEGNLLDPVQPEEEVTSWGRSLLFF